MIFDRGNSFPRVLKKGDNNIVTEPTVFWDEFKTISLIDFIQEFKQIPKEQEDITREIDIMQEEMRTLSEEHLRLRWYQRYIVHGL